jgi:hypothetical protein
MKLNIDNESYDDFQIGLLKGLLSTIYETIKTEKEHGQLDIADEYIEDLVEKLTFSVSAAIDGSLVMRHENLDIFPHLSFKSERHSEDLIVNDVGSYLHEIMFGVLDEYDLEELSASDKNKDEFLLEAKIYRERGKPGEINLMSSQRNDISSVINCIEYALTLRGMHEDDLHIPDLVEKRFRAKERRAGKVTKIEIQFANDLDIDQENWIEYPFPINSVGNYQNTISGIAQCILDIESDSKS